MARKDQPPQPKTPKVLEAEVRALLAQPLDGAELLRQLEALSAEQAFNGLTYLWGPELYRRDRVRFRPFILNHFATLFQVSWDWTPVSWKDHAAVLDPWLAEVERRGDAELFRRLYPWKHGGEGWGGFDQGHWLEDLLARYKAARERHDRAQVLQLFDFPRALLNEETALALYQIDPSAARPFILKHVPRPDRWGQERKLPERLCEAARQNGDDALYFSLYRLTVPKKTWEKDIKALAKDVAEPARLLEELEKRHPAQSNWSMDLSSGFYSLALARGRDVVPYLLKHMDSVWGYGYGRGASGKLLDHARAEGWWDVWSVLVRKGDNGAYNKEVLALVQDRSQPEEVVFRRLVMLSGASSEWSWGRFGWQQIQYLNDETALALYGRFPELAHGPFRKHLLMSSYGSGLPRLTAEVLKKADTLLIDYLTSQLVLMWYGFDQGQAQKAAERLLAYWQEQQTRSQPPAFARRVASVLGQLPAGVIGEQYKQLLENNALARLFFTATEEALLAEPQAVRDLLEAPEIHVQLLALRVLGRDDDRARRMATANLDLLAPTLLREMHRRSRLLALRALSNAATTAEHARSILSKARQALDLPAQGYPKEHLLTLIAGLCQRWPELRGPKEQPVVYQSKRKPRAFAGGK